MAKKNQTLLSPDGLRDVQQLLSQHDFITNELSLLEEQVTLLTNQEGGVYFELHIEAPAPEKTKKPPVEGEMVIIPMMSGFGHQLPMPSQEQLQKIFMRDAEPKTVDLVTKYAMDRTQALFMCATLRSIKQKELDVVVEKLTKYNIIIQQIQ